MSTKELSEWQARWHRFLSQYNWKNQIPTWKERRKNRCSYQESRRSTYSRRHETHKEYGNLTTKRKILGHTRRRRDQARRNRASRIPGQGQRSYTKRIRKRQRNTSYQGQLEKWHQGNERGSIRAMQMEGWTPLVSREDLDTKWQRTQNESYTEISRRPPCRTWWDSETYHAGQPTILLAKDARNDQTICQELRHVPAEQSGSTCTIRNTPIKPGLRPTIKINRYGLHHWLAKLRRIRHNTCLHRSPDQHEPFHPIVEEPQCTAVCNTFSKGNHMITRHTTRHYYRQRQSIYIRIMEAYHGGTRNRTRIKYGISSTNWRTNGTDEWDTRTVSTSIHQLSAR